MPYLADESSPDALLDLTNSGAGSGIDVLVNGDQAVAVRGETTVPAGNPLSGFGIYGVASGSGGSAGYFHASNPASQANGVIARSVGVGNAISALADGSGNALLAFSEGNVAVRASTNSQAGQALIAENSNPAATASTIVVLNRGTSSMIEFRQGTPSVSVARIDAAGTGYFNGGTLIGGADLAEFVSTHGEVPQPSDVVEIDPDRPGHFRLSSEANSTRVAGVISTKPGVTLNAENAATADVSGPALALAGRVPVKVTAENGAIRAGDLLVASSTPGHAMRAPDSPKPGTVIGKSMGNHGKGAGTVEVLVMLR